MRVPKYRLHRSSGQAVVTLSGRDVYLGPHGTPESKARYERAVAEWLAAGRAERPAPGPSLTVGELLAAYLAHASEYYSKGGEPTSHLGKVKRSLAPVRRLYGTAPAASFGPLALKAVRSQMVAGGLSRKVANARVGCIVRAWKWAAGEELVPADRWHALQSVEGLRQGRCPAKEYPDITPAPEADIEAALQHLSPVLAAAARVQLLTGCRPGELLSMRLDLIDRSGDVWLYRPASHKNEHRGHGRVIYVGPEARAIISSLRGGPYVFDPRESTALFRARQRAARKSKVQPSQEGRTTPEPRRKPGERYGVPAYARAVARACKKAGVSPWHPHQLRHNAATRIAAEFGYAVAQTVLGHRTLDATRIYAADPAAKAAEAMRKIG
jgi:integrase